MEYQFSKFSPEDRVPVIDILNYYIEKTFSAYQGVKADYDSFDDMLKKTKGYPAITVRTKSQTVIGFAFLKGYNPSELYNRAAVCTYFLKPEFTGKGIGKKIVEHLVDEGKKMGINSILASLSSVNERGIQFHKQNGFTDCGRFKGVRRKFSHDFDEVWMQREI